MIQPHRSRAWGAFLSLGSWYQAQPAAGRRRRKRPCVEPLESRRLLTSISEFSLSNGSAVPEGIVAGPDGNLWFAETTADKIGVINPTTHAISQFSVPTANADPEGIVAGPDGNLWFTEAGASKIGMINPTTHAVTEFATPTSGSGPVGITSGPNGNLWFTEALGDKIGMINPTTHAITEFPVPTTSAVPEGITVGPDGNLWFTETAASKVGVINPTTHAISEFATPTAASYPQGITAGSDGNIWFVESVVDKIGMINPTTHAVADFTDPPNGNPSYSLTDITNGPDGNLWFTVGGLGQVGTMNPTTHVITVIDTPTMSSGPYGITDGPDGNLWFAESGSGAIGVVTLSTHLVVTGQPPSNVTAGVGFPVSVSDEYDSGVVDTDYTGSASIALLNNPGGSALGGTSMVTFNQGVASFSGLTLNKVGSGYTLQATSAGLTAVTTTGIDVGPAAATQVIVTSEPPGTIVAGNNFPLTAVLEDQFGNVATNYSGTVTVALANNPGGSTLSGTLTGTLNQGVANFSALTLNKSGNGYTLAVSASSGPSTTTTGIDVTAAAATHLAVTSPPPGTVNPGGGFTLTVAAVDKFDNVATSYNGTVAIALLGNPGGSTLSGPATESVTPTSSSPGSATFTGLSLNNPGDGYTLSLSASGLTAATTTGINVVLPPPPAPTIIGDSAVYTQKTNKKGKKIGKRVLSGYMITFSTAMNQGTLASSASYKMDTVVITKRTKKKPSQTIRTPIGFSVTSVTANSVILKPAGSPFSKKAGLITVVGSTGVESSAGAFLASDANFNIAKGGKSITGA